MKNPEIMADTDVKLAMSTKADGHTSFSKIGDRETEANVNRFVDNLDWADESRAFMRITYGDDRTYDVITAVGVKNKPPRRFVKKSAFKVDALITDRPKVALLLPTADCYPVTLYDPNHKVLALAHIGWHSTAARLLEKVVGKMTAGFDCRPADLRVHIGPGIPAKYYVFDRPVQLAMPDWQPYLHKTAAGYEIDLLGFNLDQLKQAGVADQQVQLDPRNTAESDELESHYLQTKRGLPPARRFLTAVMMD